MRRIKSLALAFAVVAALSISAAGYSYNMKGGQGADACCDMKGCCKDAAMSCCKKKKKGKNAHACCKGKDTSAGCCCKGDNCPMPNKKAATN